MNRVPAVALLALWLTAPLAAEESAAFLKIGVGARALGMGGAYTAVAEDVSAIAWNPAGLAGLSKTEFGATHAELFANTRYDFLGLARPTRFGTWGAGAAYLSQGKLEGRDEAGKAVGNFDASDLALQLSYASRLPWGIGLGGNVKYVDSRVGDEGARTFAVDIGGMYQLGPLGPGTPQLGLAVQNLGPGMRFLDTTSPLPLTLAVGAAYRLPVGIILAVDYRHRPYGPVSDVSVGTEYAILSAFALRAGYGTARSINGERGSLAGLNGFAAGFGVRFYSLGLDYSMTPFGELGNVQRFSLGARF